VDTPETSTRDRLLEAAIAVVDEQGIEGIRVRDIAAAANVREPSVYHYFGSREGLVEAVEAARFKRDSIAITGMFSNAVAGCSTMDDYLDLCALVMNAVEAPGRAEVRSVRASAFGSAQSRPNLAKLISEAQLELDNDLATGLKLAQERGWVRPDLDVVSFAGWVNGMVNGRLIYEMNPDAYTLETWRAMTLDSALLGMGYVNRTPIWK
jgi:AcrR family transcriptional regulator